MTVTVLTAPLGTSVSSSRAAPDGRDSSRASSIPPRPSTEDVLVLAAVTWLLIAPRVDLLTVFGSSVRVDDVVLLLLVVPAARAWGQARPHLAGGRMAFVVGTGCLSAALAVSQGLVTGAPAVLYAVRPLEYWFALAALGGLVVRDPGGTARRLISILAWVTVVQMGVATLQTVVGLDIGEARFSLERGSGFTGGPYELGGMCAALACLWAARRRWLLLLVAVVGVVLSESRISLVGLVLGLGIVAAHGLASTARRAEDGHRNEPARGSRLQFAGGCLLLTFAMVCAPLWAPALTQGVGGRAESTSLQREWYFADQRAASMPTPQTSAAYHRLAYEGVHLRMSEDAARIQDVSSFIRFYRWNILLERLGEDRSWLMGLGPSFAGSAVDGSYVRVLAESGAIGLLAWMSLVLVWVRRMPGWMVAAAVTYLVGAVFIDLLFAMRPTVLMWVLMACAIAHRTAQEAAAPRETGDSA